MNAGSVAVQPGRGDGTFGNPIYSQLYGLEYIQCMAVADFNGDGRLDFVLTEATMDMGGNVCTLLGRGDGTFCGQELFPLGMDLGRQQANRGESSSATDNFVTVLDQLPAGFRGGTTEMQFCVEMVQSPEVFAKLVELRPRDRRLWYARGRFQASSREWAKASSDYEQSLKLSALELSQADAAAQDGPLNGWAATVHELAAIKLLAENEADYRELCRTTAMRAANSRCVSAWPRAKVASNTN